MPQSLVESNVEWNRINACHMDEYIGLPTSAPQSFGKFLTNHIFGKFPFKSFNLIEYDADDGMDSIFVMSKKV